MVFAVVVQPKAIFALEDVADESCVDVELAVLLLVYHAKVAVESATTKSTSIIIVVINIDFFIVFIIILLNFGVSPLCCLLYFIESVLRKSDKDYIVKSKVILSKSAASAASRNDFASLKANHTAYNIDYLFCSVKRGQ